MRRALTTDGLVSTLIRGGDLSTLVVAIARPDGLVVFEESLFSSQPSPATADSPFQELDAVLYRSPTADPDDLLIATTDALPMKEPIDGRQLAFGSEQWRLLTSARTPLLARRLGRCRGSSLARAWPRRFWREVSSP